MEKINWERTASILICLLFGIGIAYALLRFAFPLILPFLLAWLISLAVRPLSRTLAHRMHLSERLCAVLLLITVILLGAWILWSALVTLTQELNGLITELLDGGGLSALLENGRQWLNEITARIGFLHPTDPSFNEKLYAMGSEMLSSALSALGERLPDMITSLASSLPSFFFFILITVIAGFYFCTDGERIVNTLLSRLPPSIKRTLPTASERIKEVSRRYLKAYLSLLALTFVCLLVGFLILRIDYAFLLALLIAIADLLPVIGVGTVMIPWGIVMLLQKEYYVGFGLLILYLIIELVRQIAEPRFVGKSLGLHPLLTLFATFIGLQLFGILGMLLAPIVALMLKTLLSSVMKSHTEFL